MSSDDLLLAIQRLQFTERSEAEALLLDFVREIFPALNVERLELRPQAISLNSFNGFLALEDGSRLFFKTHVEQDNSISEYYNAGLLASAGYPVIQPLYSSTRSGQQLLIYPVIESPSVFDVARRVETSGEFDGALAERLTQLQHESDDALLACYRGTLRWQSAEDAAKAPIHQLFFHRLVGGRFDRFYLLTNLFTLPHGMFSAREVFGARWVINNAVYDVTLGELVRRAVEVLDPSVSGPGVVGHGDAHNGNVFLTDGRLVYFDPAFAGWHSPLLDLVKPMFHNVFAMWMYFPAEASRGLGLSIKVWSDRLWEVAHDYAKNELRQMFFESKLERVLIPITQDLNARGWLPVNWREQFKLALMCCPLLTMDLTQFPPQIALLGLCFAVEMGAESSGKRSFIDNALDRVEQTLLSV